MKQQTLVVLVVAAAVVGAGGYFVSKSARPTTPSDAAPASGALFADLKSKAPEVATIVVTRAGGGGETTVTRKNNVWVLAGKGDYPVDVSHVTALIGGLADLRPVEAKTANPELYSKLGVQDVKPTKSDTPVPPSPDQPTPPPASEGMPTLVTLKNEKGDTLLSVIVGNTKWNVDGSGNTSGVYVRKAGDKQSWLAKRGTASVSSSAGGGGGGAIDLPTETLGWIDRPVINIPRDRLKRASVTGGGTGGGANSGVGVTTVVSRETTDDRVFKVEGVPEGRELSSPNAADTLANALSFVNVDDIVAAADAAFLNDADAAVAEFRTFDGLVITTRTKAKDGKSYLSFAASVDEAALPKPAETPAAAPAPAEGAVPAPASLPPPATNEKKADEVRKEAEEINRRVSGWAFVVPEYKAKAFQTTLEEMLKPVTPTPLVEPEGPAGPGAVGGPGGDGVAPGQTPSASAPPAPVAPGSTPPASPPPAPTEKP